jgi:hypothetical protein
MEVAMVYSRYCPSIFLDTLSKIMKILRQNSRCPDQDLRPSKNKSISLYQPAQCYTNYLGYSSVTCIARKPTGKHLATEYTHATIGEAVFTTAPSHGRLKTGPCRAALHRSVSKAMTSKQTQSC